ncbi:signal peptidase I [Streptomyces sp. WAC 00631]|uniref:signal peptidase I n=1 Tax=Streptomyces TaxID=1883 RepID=UPI000F792776|nr:MULTISPECIES: signal peptidase I [Streptomyces]MCC3651455.1 signal peptidase I [Streptomyces sp. S07_1.15]MCC5035770.1 signal peptidase I [Streptomyces sp. WAC 00631]MCC9739181.1 signal peptidase I [Streptomyces sp. MNU89]WSQ73748.1 signal peptidase I [Streptomyces xinghaiensis]
MGNRGKPRGGPDRDMRLPTGSRPTGGRLTGGRAERRRAAQRIKRRRRRSAIREVPILITVAVLIALGLKTFLVQAFVIPSGSMEQTIQIGDRVLVDKLTPWFGSKPQRGDVVVFKDPGGWLEGEQISTEEDPVGIKQGKQLLTFIGLLPSDDEQDLIKRVVAVGGDTVRCCDPDGRVTVNDTAINEPYLHPGNSPSEQRFEVAVPPGRLFVMGDHRSNSADSRFHLQETANGTVPEDLVVGRALWIAWPFDHWSRLEEQETYASVPDRSGAATPAAALVPRSDRPGAHTGGPGPEPARERQAMIHLPIPAELPLVMGVVGLRRARAKRQCGVRSGCGGCGRRRTNRSGRTRGAPGGRGALRRRGRR